MINTVEYDIIKRFYGKSKAKRSGVLLINHIDEGIEILKQLGATEEAIRAYIIHPVFQSDLDLKRAYSNKELINSIYPEILLLVMEYRKTANAYLSYRKIKSIQEIELSPLKDVNYMLMADKIQNQKDFLQYHYGIHPRSEELFEYFTNWIEKLTIYLNECNQGKIK